MADISSFITAIRTARYGEEVRSSIADALVAVNGQVESDTESAGQYATSAGSSASAAANSAASAAQTASSLSEELQELHDTETAIEQAEASRAAAEQSRVVAEQSRADAASGYVNQAAEYANQARQHASSDNALLSQSWAVGSTGVRYGEDNNNSKYWAEVAAEVVTTGGVASFNGRTGNVVSVSGDYSASLITRGSGTVETALTAIESELNNIGTSDTKSNRVTFTSGDETDTSMISAWTDVNKLATNETHATLFSKISTMFKNIRFLMKKQGTTNMGTSATTITGAIAEHENDISAINGTLSDHGTSINSLSNTVSEHETAISEINSKIALSNVKYLGDDRHVRYRRTGNICIVEVEGYTVASTGNLSLGTLPVEDRPLTTAQAILKIGTSPVSGWITQSSGVVYVNALTTGTLAGEFVFFVE